MLISHSSNKFKFGKISVTDHSPGIYHFSQKPKLNIGMNFFFFCYFTEFTKNIKKLGILRISSEFLKKSYYIHIVSSYASIIFTEI